ncbi:MAG: PP2C family protein-serine/threonine phosphatase [Pyrinomonadaceae bacterium]
MSTKPQLDPSRLEALLESAQLLHSSLELEDLLRHLLRTVMGRLLVGRGLIAVESDGVMRLALVRGTAKLKAGDAFDEAAARDAGVSLILPIGDGARPTGLLGIAPPPGGEIISEEMESLKALLGLAAGGIANASAHAEARRLNQDLDQKVQELRALLDLVRGLTSTLEPDGVASLLMLTLAGRWAVRKYALAAWKESHPPVLRQKGLMLPALEDFKDALAALPEAATIESLPESEFKHALEAQGAALVFPLRSGDTTSGLVVLGARPGGHPYTEADQEFGAGLVAQALVAFENSWYVGETLERKKIEQELELAASIQEKLFPDHLPSLSGYDIAAHTRPARQCGGDYYDVLPVEELSDPAAVDCDGAGGAKGECSYLFCVADVSGKGLPASLLMSNVQATFRALLGRLPTLADLAAHTNDLLFATTPGNKYVTAVLVECNPRTGAVRYVNAGHNGGLLLRRDGAHEWLKPTGTPIGLFAGLPYTEELFTLEAGDTLALFSDGVPEAQDVSDEEFGEDRLLEFLRRVNHQPAPEIVAGTFVAVDAFAGAAPQFDDITMMVIKRTS